MKAIKIILIVLIVLTVVFIWSNSIRSRVESEAQSGAVKDTLENILTSGGSKPASACVEWIIGNIRKLAHFAEYFALSVFLSAYAVFFVRSVRAKALVILLSAPVAAIDETIQIFSNRGAALSDVLLDTLGAAAGFAVTLAAAFIVRRLINGKFREKAANT